MREYLLSEECFCYLHYCLKFKTFYHFQQKSVLMGMRNQSRRPTSLCESVFLLFICTSKLNWLRTELKLIWPNVNLSIFFETLFSVTAYSSDTSLPLIIEPEKNELVIHWSFSSFNTVVLKISRILYGHSYGQLTYGG